MAVAASLYREMPKSARHQVPSTRSTFSGLRSPVHHPPVEVGQGGSDVSQHGQGLLERQGATDGLEPVTQ